MEEKMNNKTKTFGLIFCAIAFVVMIVMLFFVDDPKQIAEALLTANPLFLLMSVACIVVYWLLEAIGLHIIMKAIHPEQTFRHTLVVAVLGQYFNCITPFSSGGQPIQAFYLVKYGAPLSSALTALLSKFIAYQFVLTVYSAIILIFRIGTIADNPTMVLLVIIGFIVNAAVIAFLLLLAFFRKAATKLAHFIVRALGKIRIVKDVDEKLKYVDGELEMYYQNFQFIKSKPWLIIKAAITTVIQLTVYLSISYVIYLSFGLSGTDYLTIISLQAFVLMISAFVPLPGAAGAAEGSYVLFFKDIFGSYTSLSTFIWRFLTFYFAIIVGIIVSLIISRGNKSEKNQP